MLTLTKEGVNLVATRMSKSKKSIGVLYKARFVLDRKCVKHFFFFYLLFIVT